MYDLTVSPFHTFCVTVYDIPVHNYDMILVGQKLVDYASKPQVVDRIVKGVQVVAGFCATVWGFFVLNETIGDNSRKNEPSTHYNQNPQANSEYSSNSSNGGSPQNQNNKNDKEKNPPIIPHKFDDKNKNHIFANRTGHIIDTPENRKRILDMVSKPENYLGQDRHGNNWFGEILLSGQQLWASARGEMIRNCGLNEIPRIFNSQTRLSRMAQ